MNRMTAFKRHLVALAGFLAVSAAMGLLSDLLSFTPGSVFEDADQIESWETRVFFGFNSLIALQNLLAYGVGAFLLRTNPLLPGLVLYAALTTASVSILHSIAVPADPSVTYLDILGSNSAGWIAGFLAAVVGMIFGYRMAQRRQASLNAA